MFIFLIIVGIIIAIVCIAIARVNQHKVPLTKDDRRAICQDVHDSYQARTGVSATITLTKAVTRGGIDATATNTANGQVFPLHLVVRKSGSVAWKGNPYNPGDTSRPSGNITNVLRSV